MVIAAGSPSGGRPVEPQVKTCYRGIMTEIESELRSQTAYPVWLEIDLDRIRGNYRVVRAMVPAKIHILCVVKDDAYGHGMVRVARALQDEGADWFALTDIREAVALRQAGIRGHMLVLGDTAPNDAGTAVDQGIALSISGAEAARDLLKHTAGRLLTVHLRVDTGMGCSGVLAENALEVLHQLAALHGLQVEGIYSHFSCADSDESYSSMQLRRFEKLLHQATIEEICPPVVHLCNSAGLLTMKTSFFDGVRIGLLLYGLSPLEGVPIAGLKPAMSLKSRIIACKQVPAGYGIGYGRTYLTYRSTRIAFLPVGYAHGYPRLLSNKASVIVRGRRAPVIGRIGMDQTTIDVTDIQDAVAGDEAVLMGEVGSQRITAGDLGSMAQSISYEILSTIGRLVPHVYLDKADSSAE